MAMCSLLGSLGVRAKYAPPYFRVGHRVFAVKGTNGVKEKQYVPVALTENAGIVILGQCEWITGDSRTRVIVHLRGCFASRKLTEMYKPRPYRETMAYHANLKKAHPMTDALAIMP